MFEVSFDCPSSNADFVLLRLLLKADKNGWSRFEVTHNKHYMQARIYFNSKIDDCASLVSSLAGLDIEDIKVV